MTGQTRRISRREFLVQLAASAAMLILPKARQKIRKTITVSAWRQADGQWHHVFGVFRTDDIRVVTIDGVTVGPVAGWNGILDESELDLLARGVCPLVIRPDDLTFYLPLFQGEAT